MTRLLVLGGTGFVGPDVVTAGTTAGMEVTVVCRGRTGEIPRDIRHIAADRTEPDWTSALVGGEWDIAVDTWASAPAAVASAAQALAGRVGTYAYVSTVSVYRPPFPPRFDESMPTVDITEDPGEVTYPVDKRAAEVAIEEAFGSEATLVVRPGAIIGPRENTRRLTRWLARAADGQPMLAPGTPDAPLQWIDARDLASFAVSAAAAGVHGHFNTIAPPTRFGDLVDAVVATTGSGAEPVWVEEKFLLDRDVSPWTDLPLWLGSDGISMFTGSPAYALAAGLRVRPLVDTVRDTWEWMQTAPGRAAAATGWPLALSADREAQVLQAWRDAGHG